MKAELREKYPWDGIEREDYWEWKCIFKELFPDKVESLPQPSQFRQGILIDLTAHTLIDDPYYIPAHDALRRVKEAHWVIPRSAMPDLRCLLRATTVGTELHDILEPDPALEGLFAAMDKVMLLPSDSGYKSSHSTRNATGTTSQTVEMLPPQLITGPETFENCSLSNAPFMPCPRDRDYGDIYGNNDGDANISERCTSSDDLMGLLPSHMYVYEFPNKLDDEVI